MTAPLRIALIAPSRFPISQPFAGGLEAHVWHLARALLRAGQHVSLFAAAGSDPGLDDEKLHLHELDLGDPTVKQKAQFGAETAAAHHAYLTLMLQLAAKDMAFDVIHNHSLHYLPVKMAPILTTPMISTLHTPPFPWLEAAIGATRGAGARFTAVSKHTAADWGHVLPDITVVGNGIERQLWPLGLGGTDLVWFGRLTPEKGTHLAIAAARRAGFKLVLAGPISNESYFAHRIAPHLGTDISYAGHLNHSELARLVGNSAAALVTPTWDEPFGLVVAEAMMCGTPVIAFNRGGIPEILDSQCGRLVAPGDVGAMAGAIPEAVELSRQVVHAHAASRCSAAAMVAGYLGIYEAMIDDRRRGVAHDRLLHPPSRQWTSKSSGEHLQKTSLPGHGDHVAGSRRLAPFRRRPPAGP